MTDLNNSNADDERPTASSDETAAQGHVSGDGAGQTHDPASSEDEITDLDAAWSSFEQSHAEDFEEVSHSRNARSFERHAKRKDKEALLSVQDLDQGTFTNDAVSTGPRDFTSSSWLDVDNTLGKYGDDFEPPNPVIGHVPTSKLVFWMLLVIGILGIIITVFLPRLAGVLGTIFGVCAFIGGAGLILRHRGHTQTRADPFDDGARV